MPDLSIDYVDIETIRPHPRNPRNGDIEAIAESLATNGQYRPIVLASDDVILAGNHTYFAALSLNYERIAAVKLPVASESEAGIKIMLADNRIAERGSMDQALLLDLLGEIESPIGTGFGSDDIDALLHRIEKDNSEPFKPIDFEAEADYRCPSCRYEWDGLPRP